MGVAAGGRLAAAVSAAGGLGLIGGGYGDAEWLGRELAAASGARVGCGFITWSIASKPGLLDAALAHRPPVVMLSFGDPAPFAARIKDAGALLACQVQSLALAREAVDAGADIIVAQGTEAGGHAALRSTFTLVPEIADHLAAAAPSTLLVAAGGVADGRGLAAALMLGADGVLMGTRFLASAEAAVARGLVDAMLAADGDATIRDRVIDVARGYSWPEGFTARGLRTPFNMEWHGREDELARPAVREREGARHWKGYREGDPANCCVLAGEAVGLVDDVPPAGEIVRRTVREAEETLARRARG